MRKLTYYVGMSLDGYLAAPDGTADFYPVTPDVVEFISTEYPDTLPTHVRAQLGIDAPNRHFAVAIQGRRTYEPALEVGVTSPFTHLRQYVVTRSITESPDPAVELVHGDPLAKVRELKAEAGGEPAGDIYLIGGSELAGQLLPEIDELVIKVYPVVAGAGIPLFRAEFSPVAFELTGTRTLEHGTVVLNYRRK
jgi:dihydrofolate reductase